MNMNGLDAEELVPRNEANLRIGEIAELEVFSCSVSDILDLITQGELCVAQDRSLDSACRPIPNLKASAPNALSFVPRESIIAYLRRRQIAEQHQTEGS
jgi:hypothetical protein